MKQPQIFHANYIDMDTRTQTQDSNGAWVPARPLAYQHTGFRNLQNRLHLAWLVFTGKCDALQWDESGAANASDDQRSAERK